MAVPTGTPRCSLVRVLAFVVLVATALTLLPCTLTQDHSP